MRYLLAAFSFGVLAWAAPVYASAQTSVHDRLTKLAQEIVYTSAAKDPMQATNLGIPGHDAELPHPSAASREAEKELILSTLTRTRWNRRRAAQELQISYKALLYKLKQIGCEGERFGAS